jgi:hypothetical protein
MLVSNSAFPVRPLLLVPELVPLHGDFDRLSMLPPWLERAEIVTGLGPRSQLSGYRRSSKIFSADAGRRCTPNTQIAQCGSKAMDHAFDLQARLAEIKQQAKLQAGRFEITGALHPMRVVQCFDGLPFDQKHVIDQQVRNVLANQDVFVVHPGGVSLHSR